MFNGNSFLGEISPVVGTEYDMRGGQLLESAVPAARGGEGFCVNYCIPQLPASQLRKSHALVKTHFLCNKITYLIESGKNECSFTLG